MFVVWGKKKVEKKLGYVAEFCPICRKITAFKLIGAGLIGHLYFIPIGRATLNEHRAQCQECFSSKKVKPFAYKSYARNCNMEIDELEKETFPDIRNFYAEQLNTEEKIRRKEVFSKDERQKMLEAPFFYLAPELESKYADKPWDKESVFGCLGTLIIPPLLVVIGVNLFKSENLKDISGISALVLFATGLITTVMLNMLSPSRYMKRRIYPALGLALRPLKPSEEEIKQCLEKLKAAGYLIGKKIKFHKLWNEIQYYNPPEPKSGRI